MAFNPFFFNYNSNIGGKYAIFKNIDGINLYYEKTGSGIPINFVHEFAGDHRSWETTGKFFQETLCITYSARGYTPSDVPNDINMYSQERAWQDIRDISRRSRS